MKMKTENIDWNNVPAVNKAMQPWLKASPSRNELARVAPMLFKNDVLTACVTKADLNKACEGLCHLVKNRSYDFVVKTVTDLLTMIIKLAPLHEEFKGPNVAKPVIYKELQDIVDGVLDALSRELEKPDVKRFSITDTVSNMTHTIVVSMGPSGTTVQDVLGEFFQNTGQAYAGLLKSITEQKAMARAVPEDQVNANPARPIARRTLAHAL